MQAEGRTRPTIDTKVCNKKVAVDDSFGVKGIPHKMFGYEGGRKKPGTWSCVDYEDSDRTRNERATLASTGVGMMSARYSAPERGGKEDALSKRFGDPRESGLKQEDGPGNCRGVSNIGRWERVNCDGSEPSEEPRGDGESAIKVRWYTEKQTNRGWPGTAEGKINTAQGMAGDLVSNLNREEKNAVAGILSKTISGA